MSQGLPKPLREALARQAAGDVHPAPDALTAFVERSLPPLESRRIVDHLAKCADCREIVFLASAAAEEPVGEEQELLPEAAVPRISPALQAKTADPRSEAVVGPARRAVPESPRHSWKWPWAWIPVAAAMLLLSSLLIQRSQLVKNAPQSSATIASKERPSSATNAPPTAAVPPEPESSLNLAVQKPLSKSAPAQTNTRQPSGTSSVAASGVAGQVPSEPRASVSLEPPSPPDSHALTLELKSAPAAIPRQNSFVESDNQHTSDLVAKSHLAPEKPQMGLLPAIVTRRQWRITADGRLEHSALSGSWTPVLTDQPAKFHVVSVVADNVWAGGNGGVLFHSADGGQNWNKVVLSSPPVVETGTIVSIQFSDAMHGIVTTDGGSSWNTSDGGVTWTKE